MAALVFLIASIVRRGSEEVASLNGRRSEELRFRFELERINERMREPRMGLLVDGVYIYTLAR
jgi:hypothetical protein